jgi:hypothetical protein
MKSIQTLFLVLFISCCWAQGSDNVVREASANENGSVSNGLMIDYKGDISRLIGRLRKDLGKGEVILENVTHRNITFKKVIKPEWTENKINVKFTSTSNGERHIITITCKDNKKNDYLIRGTDSQKKIKAYFKTVIEEE